ncbi:hypothetical protein GTY75_08930 [Streptomyces sp. SID8381]|nr:MULTISPECIES: hypothetical protein [unclassified Streptomyces]MYX26791.1 hypothetical protein [Streptomyces sp. SID8381]
MYRYRLLGDPSGTVHETTSVWLMGTIPQEFHEKMPDNAVFVSTDA